MYTDRIRAAPSALVQNPRQMTPEEIANELVLLEFKHWDFHQVVRTGQIILHLKVVADAQAFFALAYRLKFPIAQCVPVSYFDWDDKRSCAANNSSGHNMRFINLTDWLSKHATGTAFDINPVQNPCFDFNHQTRGVCEVIPENGQYDPLRPGTLYNYHPLVELMVSKGWTWGGNWKFPLDFQHFQIVLPEHEHLFPQ